MKLSTDRSLTIRAGGLPQPKSVVDPPVRKHHGEPCEAAELDRELRQAVA